MDYLEVIQRFLELRAKGHSLSGQDLELVQLWESHQVPPEDLLSLLEHFALECHDDAKIFPTSLAVVHQKYLAWQKNRSQI